jgi:hypothetical protein
MTFDPTTARTAYLSVEQRLRAKSGALLLKIERRLPRIMTFWFMIAMAGCAARIATSPLKATPDLSTVLPYILVVGAPLLSMGLALIWFRDGHLQPQPTTRLAIAGKWRPVSATEAQRHPLYGSGGIMVSLLVGMLLNVPVRALEYLASIPALSGTIPAWLSTLHFMMTLDVVLMTSLYAVAFVAALRRVPSFPRLLAGIWMLDLALQGLTARMVAAEPGLPDRVAQALEGLLTGNVWKVLISIAIWLPYLLLSKRVNVTYRHRVPN